MFAPKLFVQHLQHCTLEGSGKQAVLSHQGLRFDRAWVQGVVTEMQGHLVALSDGTGTMLVALKGPEFAAQLQELQAGDMLMVIGKVTPAANSAGRHIRAHKAQVLQPDGPAWQALWSREVEFLTESIYPTLAERQQLAEQAPPGSVASVRALEQQQQQQQSSLQHPATTLSGDADSGAPPAGLSAVSGQHAAASWPLHRQQQGQQQATTAPEASTQAGWPPGGTGQGM